MRFTEVGEVDYPDYDPEGRRVDGYVTVAVACQETFGEAAHRLARITTGRPDNGWASVPGLLMTTERHWSGYSEYTITNQWSQITLSIPDWNWEHEWESLGDFLRAMADANPEADR